MGLGELTLSEAADVFVEVLAVGLDCSLGSFLNHQARISFDGSN